jgi:hypothetical protein
MRDQRFRRARYKLYYNLLMAHDVVQAGCWRMIAPAIDEEAFHAVYRVVYVLGCGRSGTTIFSHCLGQHPEIAELNEPKHIWIGTDARSDILSPFAGLARGRLRFDQNDVTATAKARYLAMVDFQVKRRAPVVCDKAPANTCRVGYVAGLNPRAKFIYLRRSPRAVARSIERCVQKDGTWWGFNDHKWQALCRAAERHPDLKKLIPYAVDDYSRGLVEWRINHQLAEEDLSKLEPDRHIEVHYEDLVTDPDRVMQKVCKFCEVPFDQAVADFARTSIKPQSPTADDGPFSPDNDYLHRKVLGKAGQPLLA